MSVNPQQTLTLQAGQTRLTLLPPLGGLVQSLVLPAREGPIEVLAGASDPAVNDSYRGVVLFPFPNRLRDGRYEAGGKTYQFAVNETVTHTALHGLLFRTPASVEQHTQDSATLCYRLDASEPGYPFKAEVRVSYTLSGAGAVDIHVAVDNTDRQAIPVGFGWHPYFTLGVPLETLKLQMPRSRRVVVDERMLPTGEQCQERRFLTPTALGDTQLDDCFALEPGAERQEINLYSDTLALQIWQRGMHFLQLYTPPDRQAIAVEPMSCGIDAFNTGEGLIMLEPGQRYQGAYGVRLIDPA